MIPEDAESCADTIDPHEAIEVVIDCEPILEEGEQIDGSPTLEPYLEATALGFDFMTGGGRDIALTEANRAIKTWPEIDIAFKDNAAFDELQKLPVLLTLTTNSVPARTRQRTILYPFKQR